MIDSAPNVILVEDEPQIRRFVRLALEDEGWQVCEAQTMRRGLTDAATRKPDLIILDLGLPDGDGVDFVKEVRTWSNVPIIVLSARTLENDKIRALDAGADDYLTKPFGIGELLARIRSNLRRRRQADAGGAERIRFGEVEVDLQLRLVTRGRRPVHLTPTEYRLLSILAVNAGKVITNRQLLLDAWGPSHAQSSHYLHVYLRHLRQKLELDPAQPRHLLTEAGIGYRLVLSN